MDKLYCHECGHRREYVTETKDVVYKVRDMEVPIVAKLAYCKVCGSELFHSDLDAANQEKVFDIYRKEKGLLTPEQIKGIRKKYGLNQKDFSRLLGFGEITITRYENGSLPTFAHNQIIKDSQDPVKMMDFLDKNADKISQTEAERLRKLLKKMTDDGQTTLGLREDINRLERNFQTRPNVFNGMKTFDRKKFDQMVLFFAERERPYKTKLNKLMFYADWYFFKRFNRSISGSRYLCYEFGPVPENYDLLFALNRYVEIQETRYGEIVVPLKNFDSKLFTADEMEVLNFVSKKFKHFTSEQISNYSHKERAWQETPYKEYMSYEYAKYLKD